jgi:hypothetical protein
MVHALKEAHKVLKPAGVLIDLRPELQNRRAGLGEGPDIEWVGQTSEDLEDDLAANRAVARVLREGLFRRESRVAFDLDRVMDTLDDFSDWLDNSASLRRKAVNTELYQQLEQAALRRAGPRRITVRGPLMLAVLRKTNPKPPSAGA